MGGPDWARPGRVPTTCTQFALIPHWPAIVSTVGRKQGVPLSRHASLYAYIPLRVCIPFEPLPTRHRPLLGLQTADVVRTVW